MVYVIDKHGYFKKGNQYIPPKRVGSIHIYICPHETQFCCLSFDQQLVFMTFFLYMYKTSSIQVCLNYMFLVPSIFYFLFPKTDIFKMPIPCTYTKYFRPFFQQLQVISSWFIRKHKTRNIQLTANIAWIYFENMLVKSFL